MPEPRFLKLLVLEDRDDYVDNNYHAPVRDYLRRGSHNITLEVVKTKEAALAKLRDSRFDGAILDLRLTGNADEAEGNEVAKTIHANYFMPVAIVTAFHDELAPELRILSDKPSTLFRLFDKSGDGKTVFEFFFRVDQAEVLKIFHPGGEFNSILTKVFWEHLGSLVEQFTEEAPSPEMRRRVLRHTIYHVLAILQRTHSAENWDPYLNTEVYIVPPVGLTISTGEILADPSGGHFFLATPACDVEKIQAKGGYFHLIPILPFEVCEAQGINRSALDSIVKKTNHRYHLLPPSTAYPGGALDFWQLQSIPAQAMRNYTRIGQVTDPFTKDIVGRLGAWISRQGSPVFQEPVVDQSWSRIHPAPLI
jgi:hypothetical protein